MIVRKYSDIPEKKVEIEGAEGVSIRVIISEEDGAPTFIKRRFSIEPGGCTPYHSHSWEHEVYVLSGTGKVMSPDGSRELEAGSVVLVLPHEEHNFENTGDRPLVFLCSIPIVQQ